MAEQIIYWEDVKEGLNLPKKTRAIDTTLIVSGAIWASHDFMPVHHDRSFAQTKGSPDIFMNILTSNGLLASYLEQWAGPEARLKKISINLLTPSIPTEGNELNMLGSIIKKYENDGEHLIDVTFSGVNNMGPHAEGKATMALPTRG